MILHVIGQSPLPQSIGVLVRDYTQPPSCEIDIGNAYFSNVEFTEYIDYNLDGFHDPCDGWLASVVVDEALLGDPVEIPSGYLILVFLMA